MPGLKNWIIKKKGEEKKKILLWNAEIFLQFRCIPYLIVNCIQAEYARSH